MTSGRLQGLQLGGGARKVFRYKRVLMGESVPGVNGEGFPVTGDGVLEVLGAVARGEVLVGVSEVVLGHGPVSGEIFLEFPQNLGYIGSMI